LEPAGIVSIGAREKRKRKELLAFWFGTNICVIINFKLVDYIDKQEKREKK
jgi:hypothetical protein